MGRSNLELEDVRAVCPSGYRTVSVQDADHVMWLSDQVEARMGQNYLTMNSGIPLGYDYDGTNTYYDLNNPSRSVSKFFSSSKR